MKAISSPLHSLQIFVALAAAAPLALLSGCAITQTSAAPGEQVALTGRAMGGQQPISGAQIFLYAAGTTGNRAGAINLLHSAVYTGSDGSFSLTNDYTACASSTTQVYLVAVGGNPGLPGNINNTSSVLMAALGDCGNLTPTTFTYINEVTTVAAAWALSQFTGAGANVGSSSGNVTGLRNAFLVANNLVNTTNGTAGGPSLPPATMWESSKLYSLANSLAPCVNSNGGAACTPLFNAATESGVVPTNTLDAALAVVRNPGSKVANVFSAATASVPFQPALTNAPNDWTMSLTYTGGGVYAPTGIAIDSKGNAWVANYYGGVATKLSPAGVPFSALGFPDPALNESYSIAVDAFDNAWVTNEESPNGVNNYNGSLSKFSSSGQVLSGSGFISTIYYPYAIAADPIGNVWVADNGDSGASFLDAGGFALITNGISHSPQLPFPQAVAIDSSDNAWFAGQNAATRVTPSGSLTEYNCCTGASSIAIDQNANLWITDYHGSDVVELSSTGTLLQTLSGVGGVVHPEYVALDGTGNAWVSNFHGDTISGFTAATGGATSSAISPSTGFGLDAGLIEPFNLAVDASGNLWITNFGFNAVTQLVGLAVPVRTPLLGPATAP